jgi:hypothetical protein
VLESLEIRLDKTLHRNDPEFAFSREIGLYVYSEYLLDNKPDKFEENLQDFIDVSISIKINCIKYLFMKKRYNEVIEIAKPILPNSYINDIYEKSLIALNAYEQLIELYSSATNKIFSFNNFKKLYILYEQAKPELLENIKQQALNNNNIGLDDRIKLLLFLDMTDELANHIAKLGKSGLELSRDSLEKTVAKLCIVKPDAAILITRELIKQEFKLILISNYYERFVKYIEDLIELDDMDFLNKLFNTIKVRCKTKKKLLERLLINPNDDDTNAKLDMLEIDNDNSD